MTATVILDEIEIECGCCEGDAGETKTGIAGVYRCDKCGSLFGAVSEHDLPKVWGSTWIADSRDIEYVDVFVSTGTLRRARFHGWVDKLSRKIVQIG